MTTLSTHVLDTSLGSPAAGVELALRRAGAPEPLATGVTDAAGRVGALGPGDLEPGDYVLRFDTGAYFTGSGRTGFYPEVVVVFTVADDAHYHVPVLLSPFGYATYRGS